MVVSYGGITRIRFMGRWFYHPLSLSYKLPDTLNCLKDAHRKASS